MWAFQYKHGDRPLEGYTIQRAAGRGGFGEVYYAVSDSGREVALKVVQGYEAIELRGISQCMNLKSPHLVSIFDVRYNHENKPFVIMEFVSGANLRQLLDESPAGLGTQKAAFFLREIAKGLTFLHECGIVHRDLKPANIFYENGYVKIGDYGLSKHITTSQYSGQTVTVGTVHYMAPEIGAGKYDRSIDIYAMGAVLHEMLTGMPPYVGSSPTEVLMKHLSGEPDVSNIPQPFARVIQKAMAKDPAARYRSVQEMVEDVFGAEHVRQSVSVFAPEDLSVIAERAVKKTPVAAAVGAGGGGSSSMPGGVQPDVWGRAAHLMDDVGGRMKHMLHDSPAASPRAAGAAASAPPLLEIRDPLRRRQRWMLAVLVSLLAPFASMLVSPGAMGGPAVNMAFVFLLMWGGALGVIFANRVITPRLGTDSVWLQRLIVGQMAALFGGLFTLPTWADGPYHGIGGTLLAVLGPYFVFDSTKEVAPDRAERVEFGHLLGAGIAAFVIAMFFRGHVHLAIASAAGITLITQILAPWDPRAGAITKARKEAEENAQEESDEDTEAKPRDERGRAPLITPPPPSHQPQPVPAGLHPAQQPQDQQKRRRGRARYWARPVRPFQRAGWVIGILAFITMGVMFCVAGGVTSSRHDAGPFVAAGVSALMFGVLSIFKTFQNTFFGWWGYLIKPVLLVACCASIASSAIVLGNLPYNPSDDEIMIGMFFMIFPAVLAVVLLFLPGKFIAADPTPQSPTTPSGAGVSPLRRNWAIVLTAIGFAGVCGLQRLYVGKIGTGILWLVTWGLCGVGQIIDAIMILSGNFTDKQGRKLLHWEAPSPTSGFSGAAPPPPPPPPRPEPQTPVDHVVAAAHDCCDAVAVAMNEVVGTFKETTKVTVDWWNTPSKDEHAASDTPSHRSVVHQPMVVIGDLNFRGLLSALAGLLIFVATLASLGLALDVPGMLAAGVPTPEAARELEANLFADIPSWPNLMRKLAGASIVLIMFIALTVMVFARQKGGVMYMFRGVLGATGLLLAMWPLADTVQRHVSWPQIGTMVSQKQYDGAVDTFLSSFQTPQAVFAGAIFLLSIMILAWPARNRNRAASASAPSPAAAKEA